MARVYSVTHPLSHEPADTGVVTHDDIAVDADALPPPRRRAGWEFEPVDVPMPAWLAIAAVLLGMFIPGCAPAGAWL